MSVLLAERSGIHTYEELTWSPQYWCSWISPLQPQHRSLQRLTAWLSCYTWYYVQRGEGRGGEGGGSKSSIEIEIHILSVHLPRISSYHSLWSPCYRITRGTSVEASIVSEVHVRLTVLWPTRGGSHNLIELQTDCVAYRREI